VLCLAVLALSATSALWADEAADRAAIEATITALNSATLPADIFTADFPNAAELRRIKESAPLPVASMPGDGTTIQTPGGTLVISRAPMGEATWYPSQTVMVARFITRSVTFLAEDAAAVIAMYGRQPVVFVLRKEDENWRIASFRVLPEARIPSPF
jgi:hypothetical protein